MCVQIKVQYTCRWVGLLMLPTTCNTCSPCYYESTALSCCRRLVWRHFQLSMNVMVGKSHLLATFGHGASCGTFDAFNRPC